MFESRFVLTKFLRLIDWLKWWNCFWFDWFEKCMKLLQDVNLILTKILLMYRFKLGPTTKNLFHNSLALFSLLNIPILMWSLFEYRDSFLTPEIPSNCPQKLVELMQMCWKKQPQQRPVSFLHSHFISLYFFVCFCLWFDSIRHWFLFCWIQNDIELNWKIIWKIWFCFVYPSLKFTFLKHTNSEFWDNLWDVIRFNQFLSMKTSTIFNNMNEYLMKHEHKILN
jgi:hypothetical protein